MIELLNSRYGRNYLTLYSIESDSVTYQLSGTNINFISIGGSFENIIYIDPPGGPFMRINYFQHKGMVLSKISYTCGKFYLTFKHDINNFKNS